MCRYADENDLYYTYIFLSLYNSGKYVHSFGYVASQSVHVIKNLISTVRGHCVGSNCYYGNYIILMEAGNISSEGQERSITTDLGAEEKD